VITDERVEDRGDQPYAAIRATVTMDGFGDLLGPSWGEVFGWLAERGIEPAGPPLIRYRVIDMERQLEIDIGVPTAAPVNGDGRVVGDTLPAGRYARLTYRGHYDGLVDANAALQDWTAKQGLEFDQRAGPGGDVFGARIESYLTDPEEEPDPASWETEVAYRLADATAG
jgi:effector-binding domain-containing protein